MSRWYTACFAERLILACRQGVFAAETRRIIKWQQAFVSVFVFVRTITD